MTSLTSPAFEKAGVNCWDGGVRNYIGIKRKYFRKISRYFYGQPYFWTGAYFIASCGGVTVKQLKAYVENQKSPEK